MRMLRGLVSGPVLEKWVYSQFMFIEAVQNIVHELKMQDLNALCTSVSPLALCSFVLF